MSITKTEHSWRPQSLAISALIVSRKFQPRVDGIDEEQVQHYARAMHAGEHFPAIKVAKVRDKLYVVDGFHRLQAAKRNGLSVIDCEVATMRSWEAAAVAIEANAKNALPLTRRDRERCFILYCEHGLHLKDGDQPKSAPEILRDLGPIADRVTIWRWLKKYELKLGPDNGSHSGRLTKEERSEMETMEQATINIHHVVGLFNALSDPWNREMVLNTLQAAVSSLEEALTTERPANQPQYSPLDI